MPRELQATQVLLAVMSLDEPFLEDLGVWLR
jgi:hypothetical protein